MVGVPGADTIGGGAGHDHVVQLVTVQQIQFAATT